MLITIVVGRFSRNACTANSFFTLFYLSLFDRGFVVLCFKVRCDSLEEILNHDHKNNPITRKSVLYVHLCCFTSV